MLTNRLRGFWVVLALNLVYLFGFVVMLFENPDAMDISIMSGIVILTTYLTYGFAIGNPKMIYLSIFLGLAVFVVSIQEDYFNISSVLYMFAGYVARYKK